MNYETELVALQRRYETLRTKIEHCEDFIRRCREERGVTSVGARDGVCEIAYGKGGKVLVPLQGEGGRGVLAVDSQTDGNGDGEYAISYGDSSSPERHGFVLRHGKDNVGKDGSDPWTTYYDDRRVKVSVDHPTGVSLGATGFSSSVTGASLSATLMSVSAKLENFLACASYACYSGMSTDFSVAEQEAAADESKAVASENSLEALREELSATKETVNVQRSASFSLKTEKNVLEVLLPGPRLENENSVLSMDS